MSCVSARSVLCSIPVVRSRRAARDLGVHRAALRHWVRQAEADAGERKDRLTTGARALEGA